MYPPACSDKKILKVGTPTTPARVQAKTHGKTRAGEVCFSLEPKRDFQSPLHLLYLSTVCANPQCGKIKKFFSENGAFTKFLPKKHEIKFPELSHYTV